MSQVRIARVLELPVPVQANMVYFVAESNGLNKIVYTGDDASLVKEVRNLTNDDVATIVSQIQVGELPESLSIIVPTDTLSIALGKHEARLNQINSDTVGNGRWPSRTIEKMTMDLGDIRLAVFGDSFALGMDLPGYIDRDPPDYSIPVASGAWSNVLQQTLNNFIGRSNIFVDNYAFWNSNTVWDAQALSVIKEVVDTPGFVPPRIAILAYGTEDVENGESRPGDGYMLEFTTNMTEIVRFLQSKNIAVMIAANVGSPLGIGYGTRPAYRLLNRALSEVSRNTNVPFIDTSEVIWNVVNNNQEGISWSDMVIDNVTWSALAHRYIGTYISTFTNDLVIKPKFGDRYLDMDSRWSVDISDGWDLHPEVKGIPRFMQAEFSVGKTIQSTWIWNDDPELNANVLLYTTGCNSNWDVPVELKITDQYGVSKSYSIMRDGVMQQIMSAELPISSDKLPLGLSKIEFKVKDSSTNPATFIYTAPLVFDRVSSLTSISSSVIPRLTPKDTNDNRLYVPNSSRFVIPSDKNALINLRGTQTSLIGRYGLFHSLAVTNDPSDSGYIMDCSIMINIDKPEDSAQLEFVSSRRSGGGQMTFIPIDTAWTFSDFANQATGVFEIDISVIRDDVMNKTYLEFKNVSGTVLKLIDISALAMPLSGWCGGLSDDSPSMYGTRLDSSIYTV